MILKTKAKPNTELYQINQTYKMKIVLESNEGGYEPESLVLLVTSPSGIQSNPAVIKADVGFYYAEVLLNEMKRWEFSWKSTLDGIEKNLNYSVNVGNYSQVNKLDAGLNFNQLVVVEIDSSIEDATNKLSLEKDLVFSFSTEYNPFYCSVEMLRMEMGEWANLVPNDTMALAIHWSSLEANSITSSGSVSEEYFYARSRFVMYDASIKLFSMPFGAEGKSGQSKQLGDLIIQNGNSLDYPIKDLIQELKEERDEWWRVVNARGKIVTGQGLGPSSATKGGMNGTKRSREWHDPWSEYYLQPTQNSQYKRKGQKKHKHGFTGWNEYYFTSVKKGLRNK